MTKLNDYYFNQPTYNSPAWRQLVTCQEIGHTFGLDHQDESFSNPNLGTCMDYTNDPSTNQHPNAHDYDQLATIYAHLDSTTTVGAVPPSANGNAPMQRVRDDLWVEDLGNGQRIFTFVFWADRGRQHAAPQVD